MRNHDALDGAVPPGGILTFEGTRFEVGRRHGEALRDRIREEMEHGWVQIATGTSLDRRAWQARFYDRHLSWLRHHLPMAEAEVAGLADGAELSLAEAFFAGFHGGASPSPDGTRDDCTAFYCGSSATANGDLFLGQTKDTATPSSRYQAMRLNYRDGVRSVILNYPGWLANIGLTSRGMTFTGNARYCSGSPADGLPLSLLKKFILEAESVQAVKTVIEADAWQDGGVLIADRGGSALCAEFVRGRSFLTDLDGGVFAHANTVLSPEAASLDDSAARSPSSIHRQRRARDYLAEKRPVHDFETLRCLSRDHSTLPSSICLHPSPHGLSSTTAAVIANLTSGHLEIAVGQPCRTPFIRYSV